MLQPRWYQQAASDAVWQFLCNKPGNPVVCLPTGSGKSLVIAMLAYKACVEFGGRVLVLQHRKELIQQNAEKIRALMPELEIGLFSAGLRRCQINEDVIVAGIQSVYSKAAEFGRRHLVIIDESHLVPGSGEGMYRRFLKELGALNRDLRIVGLTATPYRTGEGKICRPDAIFQEICYSAPITQLIQEGYLSNLVTKPVDNEYDTSGLKIRGGEFIEPEVIKLFDDEAKIELSVREIVAKTQDRQSIITFCPGVYHAQKTKDFIESMTGQECGLVTGDTMDLMRSAYLDRFKRRQLRWLVNIDVLTTGFDAPCVDAIAILRATNSPGLFAQICGRGLRTYQGKNECFILDFGENLKRFGPLDSESFGEQSTGRGKGKGDGDAPLKTCPSCEAQCPISAAYCECGWKFPPPTIAKHGTEAGTGAVFEADIVPTRWIVQEVAFRRNTGKEGKLDTLRVDYICQEEGAKAGNLSLKTIPEWVCLEHDGYAQTKAKLWWKARTNSEFIGDIDATIDLWKRGAFAAPTHITTKPRGKYFNIVSVDLDERPETWREAEPESEVDDVDQCFDAFAKTDDVPF